jgi:MSHA biogenesis protein MshI
MAFFVKTKKNPGWLAVDIQSDGAYAVHVTRVPAAKPVVETAAFYSFDSMREPVVLEKLAKELNAARFECTTLLRPGEYQLLSVDAPNVPPDELRTAIRWRLKDLLDFHIDDATIDVLDVPVDKNANTHTHSMYAIAARNQLIRDRQSLFAESKLPLSVIDIPEMAQRNIANLVESGGRGIAMLSFNAYGGLLTISYNNEMYLSRRIDVPLSQLDLSDAGQRSGSYERITLELQRSLDHFERQYQFIAVSRLLISPLGKAGSNLQAYLTENLYIPVEMLTLGDLLDLSRVPNLGQQAAERRYFMTIGAALRHEESTL